ncbi:efflux RND transporter permease subunit [Ammoniphilus sp. YIM 78166]|uniref:efflux RND transporter permease subunit n=1 Tax=Ammoniphilus sp. YIM 78166 TaxID=1644106 RepID=UPI00106FFFD5|nr:efflux RND transporter permease subunit [Ammoniphilus sp. YIM 78166]
MIEYLVRKRKITVLFFIMVTLLGILSFFQLPKQEQPEIIVNMATVTTIFPGASPEKVEQTVTKKLEVKINELQGLKSITSTSALGVSSIVIEAENGIDPKAKWEELRKKVKDAEANLPADAHQPIINDDLNRTFIQTFNVYADSFEQLYSVRELIKDWKDELRTIPKVADVTIDGLPDKQVTVEIDTQKLQQYGIHWGMVLNAIQKENEKTPLGDYQVGNRTFELRLDEVQRVDDFANTLITRSREGYPVYLKDVGTVEMTTKRVKEYYYHNGKPAVSISLNAEFGSDVPSLQARVDEKMAYLVKDKPTWLKVESIHTQNERVNHLFGDLTKEMLIAITAVIFVCTLGLNMITSFVVALAIPISIAVGLIPLPYMGISLNQISIVGLIIVLGILVDDAVVVNDNIERRLSVLGEKPFVAAVNGSKEVAISIVTATLATIASFGPLFFLEGNAGQFIKAIPIIITLSMLASMVMSLTIIPIFREWHESRKPSSTDSYRKPAGLLGKQIQSLTHWYANTLLKGLLKKPLLTGVIGILIGSSAYGLLPLIPVELFPMANRPEMYVNITAPVGSNINETDELVREVSDWLQEQPEVTLVAAYAGNSAPKMFGGDTGNGSGERVGQVIMKVDHKQYQTSDLVIRWNEEFKRIFPGASVVVKELEAGPPVGAPVVIRIFGEDIEQLRALSQTVKDSVVKVAGTKDIKDSFGAERNTLQFRLNKEVMDKLIVNPNDVSKSIRLVSEGMKITEFDDGDELVEMILKMKTEEEDPSTVFQRITVPNAMGQQIQLSQIASVEPGFAMVSIGHRNLSRVVTITSDVQGRTATEVMNEIKPKLAEVDWPEGYRFEIAGETSEQTEIFIDMGKLSVIVVFLILILIAMQFYSLSIPLLVMSTIYLAFAGSLIGLFVTQTPLGFMTMMGVISLAGIVVRNGIVLVEFIEEARREGVPLLEAVIHAGEARFRPILLTSATAISGLTPLATIGDVLFRPLAITIIFGLAFSTLLTLIIVPSLYVVMAERKVKKQAKKRQRFDNNVEIGL